MIAVDTNVLARFLLEDNKEEHAQATAVINWAIKSDGIFVPSSIFIELVWLLKKNHWDKSRICDQLEALSVMPGIVVGMRECVIEALKMYRHGKADFADYFIVAESKKYGAKSLASFDTALTKGLPKYCKHPEEFA